ncbi:MAG: threonylcarbamoyl-AMP synthase [Clostridiales bacterium]|nr:threonylcarbamoyl-AMP synthase [Clostridiales bacterium]
MSENALEPNHMNEWKLSDETRFETKLVSETDEAGFAAAARALAEGEVVGMPTETVYGLGCDARNPEAVARVYEAKGRPSDNPLIVHVASKETIPQLVSDITPVARVLIDAFMPGPITVIMKKSSVIPDCVSAGLDTVGIRFPIHPVAQALIARSGVPVAAPSANLSGSPSPTKSEHVMKDMNGRIPYVVEGGECQVGLESTVVDATGNWPQILRPGAVTMEQMEAALAAAGMTKPETVVALESKPEEAPRAPGMKYRHYAPSCEVHILGTGDFTNYEEYYKEAVERELIDEKTPVGLFVSESIAAEIRVLFEDRLDKILFYTYGETADVEAASHHLFDGLRLLDEQGAQVIFAPAFPKEGLGVAYMNRLEKAAAENVKKKEPAKESRRVLFVCSGNTCRSPLAEAIMKSLWRDSAPHHMLGRPDVEAELAVSSAGVATSDGRFYTRYSEEIAEYEYNVDISKERSTQLTEALLAEQDLVVCVTDDHSHYLRSQYPEYTKRVFSFEELLEEFHIEGIDGHIADPYGREYEVYQKTASQIDRVLRAVFPEILKKWEMT